MQFSFSIALALVASTVAASYNATNGTLPHPIGTGGVTTITTSSTSSTPTPTSTSSPTFKPFDGAASVNGISGSALGLVVAGSFALFF